MAQIKDKNTLFKFVKVVEKDREPAFRKQNNTILVLKVLHAKGVKNWYSRRQGVI
jgi:hypothetical protein